MVAIIKFRANEQIFKESMNIAKLAHILNFSTCLSCRELTTGQTAGRHHFRTFSSRNVKMDTSIKTRH